MQLLSAVSNNQPLLKPVVAANSSSKASWKHACSVSFHNPHACLQAHGSVYCRYGLITFTKEIEAARQNCSPSPLLAQLDYVDTLVEILMQTLQHKQADRPEMHTIHQRLVSLKRQSSQMSPLMTAQNRSNEPALENLLVCPHHNGSHYRSWSNSLLWSNRSSAVTKHHRHYITNWLFLALDSNSKANSIWNWNCAADREIKMQNIKS